MANHAPSFTTPGGEPVFMMTDKDHHPENGTSLGFWIYLMSDCLIFAILFATFGVLNGAYAAGPGPRDLFDLNLIAINTALLLVSSITFGFAMLAAHRRRQGQALAWMAATGLLGLAFLGVEIYEFSHMIHVGATPQRSAFLSAFFALVGTHGLHVAFGVLWLVVLMIQVAQRGLIEANVRRLMCLSLFWHFLDVIWIGVFSFVYLLGVVR